MSHVLRAQGSTRSTLGYRVHHGPDVSVHYSTAAAGPGPRTFSLTRDKETLQTLNGRLEVYLNQVQSLESANQRLEQQIQEELDRKYPRHLRGPVHHLRGLGHHLRTASHLQNQICRCLSVQSELKLKLLGAGLTVVDIKDRLDREREHRRRLEEELKDLKVFWEELKNHHLPELHGWINVQTQQLAELKTQQQQDLQGLLVQGSGGVTVKMQDVQASVLNQQPNHPRNVSRFTVQVSMMVPIEEPLRSLWGSEVTELVELKRSVANLETELNQLQAVNVMLEASALQKSQSYVLQLGVLQQRADVLCTDLDSVLQAAAQKAKDHEALLDVKNQLEAEIQDYKRLLDGLNIQRVSNSNPVVASFRDAFIPARRNIPVRVQRGHAEIAVQPVSRGHISPSRPQPLEAGTRFQPVQRLHGSPTVEEVSLPSTKSQTVAGRRDEKLEVTQETKQSGQVGSSRLVESLETGRAGDEGSTAVFDMIGSDICKSVVSQGNVSVEEKVQVLRLDQRLLLSDVSLSKNITKTRDPGLGRPEELQTITKTVVSESSVIQMPRTELRKPSVEVKETETMDLASGSEDSQVSGEVSLVDEKDRKEQDKMDEEEKVQLDGVRLDLSSLSDVSRIKPVTDSAPGTSADLLTNARTGVKETVEFLNTETVVIWPETSQMEEKEMIRQEKTVKENQVVVGGTSQVVGLESGRPSELQTNIPTSTNGTRDVLSADVGLQESGAPAGVQLLKDTPAVTSSLSSGALDKDEKVQQGKKGEEKQVVVGGSSYDAGSGSGRPSDLQTSARAGISGTRDLLNAEIVVILPETSQMEEKQMIRQERKGEEKQVVVRGTSQVVGTESGRPSELQSNANTGVSGTRDLPDAQVEMYLTQAVKTEPNESVTEKDKNVKEKKVEEFGVEGPSLPLRFNQSLSDSSVTKQTKVAESESQTTSTNTTIKILNEAKVHEGILDIGFHDTNDLKTCHPEVVSEAVGQTGQDAKKSINLTVSGGVCVSLSEPGRDVDPVLSPNEAEIDLDTVETEEFMMDEVFCPGDLKDHPELLLDPSDSDMFLFQHDSEMCPNDEDDDDEFCLTEANMNVRPVEKYLLSTKESQSLCLSGDGDVPDEDGNRNVMVSVEVRDSFGSFVGNERDSEFDEEIITDKEEQLGFGSDRYSGNACGFEDKVLGPGVIEGVDVNRGNSDTAAGFNGKAGTPSGRVSGKVGSFGQTYTGRRDGHFMTTLPSKQTVRVGSRTSAEQMVYGGQPGCTSSGAGRSSVNSAESRGSLLVSEQLPSSPQGAARFCRRGSGDWTVYGGPAGGGTNHPSSTLPVVGSKLESTHLPTSPLEKGRIGRRDSGEWILYDRNRLQSAESEGSPPVVMQLPTSPPEPVWFGKRGSGEYVLYGGSLIRRNSFDDTWVEVGPSLVTNCPKLWSGRRGSGEGVVYGGLQRTRSSEIEQFPNESPHPMSPPGAARFSRRGSGEWVIYGRREERTPATRQRATSSSGAPRAGRFSNGEDREQKAYGTNPGGVVKRSGSVGSGGRLTRSSSSGGLSSNRRSSMGSVGQPGRGVIISTNRAPSPGGKMSFSGGSGGWSTSSPATVKRISRAGSSDRLSGGRVRSSSVSGGGGGRVITSSSRSTGSASGSKSNRDRISVCKMAAMSMSAAGKERSQDQKRRHQREAEPARDVPSATAAVQRWLTSGDLSTEPDRPDGSA